MLRVLSTLRFIHKTQFYSVIFILFLFFFRLKHKCERAYYLLAACLMLTFFFVLILSRFMRCRWRARLLWKLLAIIIINRKKIIRMCGSGTYVNAYEVKTILLFVAAQASDLCPLMLNGSSDTVDAIQCVVASEKGRKPKLNRRSRVLFFSNIIRHTESERTTQIFTKSSTTT